ncbi:hypothetical protein, partial [Synechococcus sp. MIT S9508]|uniref:hypothetical protein n=1 Tax=Synechococcus sp. MIT S9508 TaxID=1801629 RepID=UPI001E3AA7F4
LRNTRQALFGGTREPGDDYCSSHQASSSQVRALALVGLRFSVLASSRITGGGETKNGWTRMSLLLT